MKDEFKRLMNYVHKMENKYGTVTLMDKRESSHMQKLSKPCYKNEYANFNQYEIEMIKRYLSGDINDRQLTYYLGGIKRSHAFKMVTLYVNRHYDLTNHKNYWE